MRIIKFMYLLLQTSSNILIKDGIVKITDFGLSRHIISSSIGTGAAPYKDPQSFTDQEYRFKKESDIFSLGVVLWEISSQKEPCEGCTYSYQVACRRRDGYRDPRAPGTPEAYFELYSECWDNIPEQRPNVEQVYERLESLLKNESQNLLDDTSVFLNEPEPDLPNAPVNGSPSSDCQYLSLVWIRSIRTMAFEKIFKPNYDSACRELDRIKTELLQSNPCLCSLYNISTNVLKSDDPLNTLYVALGEIRNGEAKELAKMVESNSFLRHLYNIVVTV